MAIRLRTARLRLPTALVLALPLLGAPFSSSAGKSKSAPAAAPKESSEVDAKTLEAAPLSLRGTRGAAHPDCKNQVPMWEHEVREGEHLGLIAGRYGVRRAELVELNAEFTDPNLIKPGQRVKVCPEIAPRIRENVTYIVRGGDSLSKIAAAHGLTAKEVSDAQDPPLSDPNRLLPGQELKFWVDRGSPEAFLPPLPKPPAKSKKRSKRSGLSKKRKLRHAAVNVQLTPSDDVHIKRPHLAFGTKKTIGLLSSVVAKYKRKHAKGPRVLIGDISKRGGGKLHPHLSHQRGHDFDVGYVLKGAAGSKTRFSGVNRSNFDAARTWALVKAFLDTKEIRYIFMDYGHQKVLYDYAKANGVGDAELDELFQYPRGRGRNHGLIRHWRSHKNHFHVRFSR